MSVYSELCMEHVSATDGVPLGIDGYDDFRFVLQVAITTPENTLPFILGTSQLGGPRWRDITGDVQGMTWSRGAEPAQRPIAGELSFRLNNPEYEWSPWYESSMPVYGDEPATPFYLYGPGTMVRIVVGDGITLLPQFCGQVQSWNEASVGLDAYKFVDVTVWENLYLLAEVDDHGLAGVVGGGETLTQRVDRLLTQADWQFDRDIEDTTGATFQSTNLAQDVATELYLTVDSVDAVVYPAKDGMLMIRNRSTGTGNEWIHHRHDQNPDSIVTANDDERILTSVDLARVGGTSMTFTNVGLASRYQRRSTQRNDMITVSEADDADLQRVADGMLARARMTYRPVSIELQSGHGPAAAKLMIESDLTDRLTLDADEVVFTNYAICAFAHSVIVAAAGVYWTTTISLDIEADSSWARGVTEPAKWDRAKWDREGWT